MNFEHAVELAGKTLDTLGILAVVVGTLAAMVLYGPRMVRGARREEAYTLGRQMLGRAILLGLEFLVAGDIIRTVAISPTFQSVGVLALIVLVRTFLSATLQVEIEGRWPWQQAGLPSMKDKTATGETAGG